jgi:hypothetical protein
MTLKELRDEIDFIKITDNLDETFNKLDNVCEKYYKLESDPIFRNILSNGYINKEDLYALKKMLLDTINKYMSMTKEERIKNEIELLKEMYNEQFNKGIHPVRVEKDLDYLESLIDKE